MQTSEVDRYLLTVKQDLRQFMEQSPFFLKGSSEKKEIERYTDKYKRFKGNEIDNFIEWRPDWKYFPTELQIGVKKRKRTSTDAQFKPLITEQKVRERKKVGVPGSSSVFEGTQKKVTFASDLSTDERLALCVLVVIHSSILVRQFDGVCRARVFIMISPLLCSCWR